MKYKNGSTANIGVCKFLIPFLLVLFTKATIAQNVVLQSANATTAQATVNNITICYTIGEMILVNTQTANGLLLTQGCMQPDKPNNYVNNNAFVNAEIKLFPIPVTTTLNVQIALIKMGKMKMQLCDMLGQIVLTEEFNVTSFMTKQYNLAKFSAAMYLLKLEYKSTDGIEHKKGAFKIVKQN